MRRWALVGVQRILLILLIAIGLSIGLLAMRALEKPPLARQAQSLAMPTPTSTVGYADGPPVKPGAKVPRFRVGVVAGHWQNDSGATCPDGLQEVQINLAVAREVVSLLNRRGYQAELFPEFADQLSGYTADAFVAIHADSCDIPGASGFKVAHVEHSAVPEEEDRLVNCLWEEYQKMTGLSRHEGSITTAMLNYHNFRQIAPGTPGAIIELGFMGDDRDILVNSQKVVARGVAAGIVCYLEGKEALK
jgi:N-acetylmuramoyl-L-alanine amidase